MRPTDLCVPIYLNQQIVFDLLAILEDGFSELSTVRFSEREAEAHGTHLGGGIGLSNVFALLGVSFKASAGSDKGKATDSQTDVFKERVHTPTSLFARLRLSLKEQGLLKEFESVAGVSTGDFVEFRAVLRKNPLIDMLEAIKRGVEMTESFSGTTSEKPQKNKAGTGAHAAGKPRSQVAQINAILEDLKPSRSLDLIGEVVGSRETTAVLSAKLDFFSDQDASELIDGEYQVLGKVTRVVPSVKEAGINLLRKTSFGLLSETLLEQVTTTLVGAKASGINLPRLVTKIEGPALQLIPIAVFA